MFKCILIRRKLYDYLDDSLSERERASVKEHLKSCSVCRKRLEQMGVLLNLAKSRKTPQPKQDFWHNFKIELDRKLNSRLVPPFDFRPNLSYRLKPVLVLTLVSVIILVTGLSMYFYSKPIHLAQSDSSIVDEIDLLEELDTEISLNHDENAYMDELDLLYELNQEPA